MTQYGATLEVIAAFLTAFATVGLAILTWRSVRASQVLMKEREEERAAMIRPGLLVPALEFEKVYSDTVPPNLQAATINVGGSTAFDILGAATVESASLGTVRITRIPYGGSLHLGAGRGMDIHFPLRTLVEEKPPVNYVGWEPVAGDVVDVQFRYRSMLGVQLVSGSVFRWNGETWAPSKGSPGRPILIAASTPAAQRRGWWARRRRRGRPDG
ncbi:MAG: hypothetical protein ACYCX3_06660 [Thermoleophilia bacterium]